MSAIPNGDLPIRTTLVIDDVLTAGKERFWPDDISLLDAGRVDSSRLLDPAPVMDSYLLALALERGGKLATFDARLVTDAVINGPKALHVIR
jgi:predicted nucleic acid-binding protein